MTGLPTFFIVDPATEKVALRWLGSATVPQMHKILADGRQAVAATSAPSSSSKSQTPAVAATAALMQADQLFGAGDNAGAATAYEAALAKAPADWPQRARASAARPHAGQES